MVGVIEALPVRFFMDRGEPDTTATYRELIRSVEERPAITYLTAEPRVLRLGSAELHVLPMTVRARGSLYPCVSIVQQYYSLGIP